MKLHVWATADAEQQIQELGTWWRFHRPAAKDVFKNELNRVYSVLQDTPNTGVLYDVGIPGLRRLRLKKTPYYIYYVHRPEHQDVAVLAVWSAMRGEGPPVRMP